MKIKTYDIRYIGTDPVHLIGDNKRVSFLPNTTTMHITELDWEKIKSRKSGKFLIDEDLLIVIQTNEVEKDVLKELIGDDSIKTVVKEDPLASAHKSVKVGIIGANDKIDAKGVDWGYVETLSEKTNDPRIRIRIRT